MHKFFSSLLFRSGQSTPVSGDQQPATHPADEVLDAYCFYRLAPADAAAVKEHATVCVSCYQGLQQSRISKRLIRRALGLKAGGNRPASGEGNTQVRRFISRDQVLAAKEKLPISQSVVGRCLSTIADPNASLETLGALVAKDPVIAAHLVAAANSALVSRRQIDSLGDALAQLGLDRVRLHILGASLKGAFTPPEMRQLWDHSIATASLARDLAELCKLPNPEAACLAGLVHDLGAALLAISGANVRNLNHPRPAGVFPVEDERRLLGADHGALGAEVLSSWFFPADLVESVRYHHAPSLSDQPLTSVLYLAELFADREEAYCHAGEHAIALKRLGLSNTCSHSFSTEIHPDLQTLQLAA